MMVHLQAEDGLDFQRLRSNVWMVRDIVNKYVTTIDPAYSAVCGVRSPPKTVRRGELSQITCDRCRAYYLRFVGGK